MKIISFAWTTPALIAGEKTVTRRHWNDDYAGRFKAGEIVQAFDRSPRHGGKAVALIEIESVTYEPDTAMPASDYEAEGFAYLMCNPDLLPKSGPFSDPEQVSPHVFAEWRTYSHGSAWVVRFTLKELTPLGETMKARLPNA